MATQLSEEKKVRSIVTPEFRLGFNFIFTPKIVKKKTKDGGEEPVKEYLATAIFDKDADFKQMKALAIAAMNRKWPEGKPRNYKSPFVAGEDRLTEDGKVRPEYKNKIVMYFKNSFRQPGIVNEDRKPFLDETKLYAGCYCVAEVTAFAWTNSGNNGISFSLENLMKVGDGERLAGGNTPEEAFKAIVPRERPDNSAELEKDDDEI